MRIGRNDTPAHGELSRCRIWIRRQDFGTSGALHIRRRRVFAWVVWWNRSNSELIAWMLYIEALHRYIGEHRIGGRSMNWIFGSPIIKTPQE